jgi:hypothetical protein
MTQLGDQSGRAIAESMDSQVFDLFPSFTQSVGSTGAEVTIDSILQAAATLRSNKLTGPFFAVLHPKVAYNIKKQLTYSSQTNVPALSAVGDSVWVGKAQYYRAVSKYAGCDRFRLIFVKDTAQSTATNAGTNSQDGTLFPFVARPRKRG